VTASPILALAWLVLAHFVADFVFQTNAIVRAKNAHGRRAASGLFAHGAIVAVCLVPAGLAWGGPGWAFLVVSAVLHVVVDRAKVVLTRRAAARALAEARRVSAASEPADHLGRAWTPAPGALFLLDQLAHLAVAAVAWAGLLASAPLTVGWVDAVNRVLAGWDRATVHGIVSVAVVLAILALINIRAAAMFVAVLVRPVEAAEGELRWGGRATAGPAAPPAPAAEAPAPGAPAARRWRLRLGPIEAQVEADEGPIQVAGSTGGGTAETGASASGRTPATTARIGATIGILERILIVVFVLTGSEAAIGFVVAAKTLARFRLLDDRDFAEYYLLGTLASVAVAIVTGLVGRAAISALLA
jgi:hypothetical protein